MGQPITEAAIAIVLSHPEGGAKGSPPGARIVPLINKVESEREFENAQSIARLVLASARGKIRRVVISHVQRVDPVIQVISN
jgi:molybdenum cofactor cytidylyltransferase